MEKKSIAILGSTGSIGTQALKVVENHAEHFEVVLLTAGTNFKLLIKQALKHLPKYVVIAQNDFKKHVEDALSAMPTKVYSGPDAIAELVAIPEIDIVLTAMVGYAGLLPTIKAIEAKKNIALANKETFVVAGELITKLATTNKVSIFPVDSEHSAIFQCLMGEDQHTVEKIILTASGGPFRGKSVDYLKRVTKEQALNHPNWCMGNKITIDSATLMNKGLEAIEAKWLFQLQPDQIEIVIHPQSIIHSAVQFIDGSIKAQMGLPDMKLPIQYALGFSTRLSSDFKRFNFFKYPQLSFEKPDFKIFRNLELAFQAIKQAGNMPCIMNAANEIAVEAFLNDQISFLQIPEIIEHTMSKASYTDHPGYEDYVATNTEARKIAFSLI